MYEQRQLSPHTIFAITVFAFSPPAGRTYFDPANGGQWL